MHWPIRAAVVLFLVVLTDPAHAQDPLAGVAVVDITPPIGYPLSGYYHERGSTSVHDPLQAKALVLRQGSTRIALVVCDLCAMWPVVSEPARARIERETGIPAGNIAIAATHTHTGPDYHGLRGERWRANRSNGFDYTAFLIDKIVEAVEQADRSAAPAELRVGVAEQHGLAFQRRFHLKSGFVRFNPGKLNPDILAPAAPIDPQVGLLMIRPMGGHPPALLNVFALHLDTVGGSEISADYPYHLEQRLRESQGPTFTSIFANGTCGDINHFDITHKDRQHGHEEARRIGRTLGATIEAQIPSLRAIERASLAARSRKIDVPYQRYGFERIAWARQTIEKSKVPFLQLVEAWKIVTLERMGMPESRQLEVQAFRIAPDTAIVTLPGEVFVEIGLAIKNRSPFNHTFVIELTNDTPAYIPTLKGFAQGGYEAINSQVAPGGGELLVDAAVDLLGSLNEQ